MFCITNPAVYLCATKLPQICKSHQGICQRKHTSAPHEDNSTTKTIQGQMIRPTNHKCDSQHTGVTIKQYKKLWKGSQGNKASLLTGQTRW